MRSRHPELDRVHVAMEGVTAEILHRMEAARHSWMPEALCAWDINCGWCEEWAMLAQTVFPPGQAEVVWLDEVDPRFGPDEATNCGHAVLMVKTPEGPIYFDSQHPGGVRSVYDLDIVRQVSREDFLGRPMRTLQAALVPTPRGWTSGPLPLGAAQELARWWDGFKGASGFQWSAEVRKANRGLYVVRVW